MSAATPPVAPPATPPVAVPLARRDLIKGAVATGALALLSPLLASPLLASCATGPSPKAAELEALAEAGSPDAFWFTDSAGRRVALPTDITRVSPSGAYAQIMLTTLCPNKLCSLSSRFSNTQARYLGEHLATLPVLGRYYGKNADMNYEEIIRTDPDVIIDIGEEKTDIANDMDGLQRQTGLPVIFIEATLPHMDVAYEMLGEATTTREAASALSAYAAEVLTLAAARREEVAARGLKLLYSGGEFGLDVVAKGSVHSGAIDALGADNVAVLSETNSTLVSIEQVMLWAPDVLLLSPAEGYFLDIFDDGTWAEVPAVADERVYEVPAAPYEWLNKPPSVQTLLGLLWLGNLLYPDIYDIDIVAEAQRFYSLFWHYDLSAAEAQELVANSTFLEQR
jgi:iron complex transport system substrate-binding protein